MINPTPTTCIAISLLIPKEAHATGINNKEPPATPDAPHAPTVETKQSSNAVGKSTAIPKVCAAANASTEIVMDAPAMLMVAPRGIEIVYISGFKPKRLQRSKFTGMLAAELLVKNAYNPLSRSVVHTNGNGFLCV